MYLTSRNKFCPRDKSSVSEFFSTVLFFFFGADEVLLARFLFAVLAPPSFFFSDGGGAACVSGRLPPASTSDSASVSSAQKGFCDQPGLRNRNYQSLRKLNV